MLGTVYQKSSQALKDLLFPPQCLQCKALGSWLCESCSQKIPFISSPICEICGTPAKNSGRCSQCNKHPLQDIDGIRVSAFFEDNPVRAAIHALKYQGLSVYASILSGILADTFRYYDLEADIIVPVPLHRSRLNERGFNQSKLLAKQLGKLLDIPVNATTLQRIRKTESQMTLGSDKRQKNVSEAFACSNNQLDNQSVLLVDDVCTTGATLDACAAALKQSGATTSVWGLTVAKAR